MSTQSKDPYTEKASEDASLETKVSEVKSIVKAVKTGMLTLASADGSLHSRAMAPADFDDLTFSFIANNESGKTTDIQEDGHANVSFFDPSSTSWVSVAGKAKLSQDRERIKKLFNPIVSAWFGDLGDGKHDGSAEDPRVALIVVEPSEIRYWAAQRTKVGQLVEVVSSAVTGNTAAPGKLRTISAEELKSL